MDEAEAEFAQFKRRFVLGQCYLCGLPLDNFSKASPCLHWLLKPRGFRKDNLLSVTNNNGIFQMQAFLRWVANQADFARNINDMPQEGTGKLIEVTIRYRNISWSFSCAENDYHGHKTGTQAKFPHYHFQMTVNGYPFIKYNDFHIPLKERDILIIEAMRALPNKVKAIFPHGEGMDDVLHEGSAPHIVNTTSTVLGDDSDNAQFEIETMIMATEGKKISGDDISMLIEEAREKNVTFASLAHKLQNANISSIVSPGPGVIAQAPRTGGRNKKRRG